MNILLLEDNKTDADLTRRGLTGTIPDCTVEVVQTLKQAKEILTKGFHFDLALVDMNLPDGNGMDLLMEIRQSKSNIPVIILTGSGNEEVAVAALKAGANDYVIKRQGYISKLPGLIDFVMISHQQNQLVASEFINALYIEHHAADIDLTRRHLSQYAPNIQLTVIPTAEQALELLPLNAAESCNFKVILIDYRLPGLNALEFIKIIRQERKLQIPVILITGHGNEEVAIQSLKLGANEYLVKRENYLYRLPSLILSIHQHCELIKKQAALAESEEKYRAIFENVQDVFFQTDMAGNILEISPSVKYFSEFQKDELIGTSVYNLYYNANERDVLLNAIMKNGEIRDFEVTLKTKAGEKKYVSINARLIFGSNGKPIHIDGAIRDISERKLAEKQVRLLSRAIEQSPVTILITDKNGIIEYANPKFTELSGFTLDEIKGKNPRILQSGQQTRKFYKKLWDTILSGKEWNGELHNKKKNGESYWESALISPIIDSQKDISHFIAVKEDITEKKKMIEDLIQAKEQAEESDRLKSSFLANMSHEIRTPMNGILGFAELLKEADLTSAQQQEYIHIIEISGARMLNIINDIVDISKIESGQMKVSVIRTNINELMEFIQKFFKTEVEQKGLRLTLTKPLPGSEAIFRTDREKLYSILTNLIKNAIKYTKEGSIEFGCDVVETLHATPLRQTFLKFYVKDTGIGIPKHRQEAIFERFIQADISDKMARQGAGLGLAISKAYAEMLGGRIWVDSEEGVGSTFYFTLPYMVEPEEKIIIENIVLADLKEYPIKKLKILIAEDDESSSRLISIEVQKFVKEIILAQTGIEAVEACRNNPDVDLIMMDIQMPEMNGYDATRLIREFNKKVIIIAQTAYGLSCDREKALEAGCNNYISKPIKKDKLMELLSIYFSFN